MYKVTVRTFPLTIKEFEDLEQAKTYAESEIRKYGTTVGYTIEDAQGNQITASCRIFI